MRRTLITTLLCIGACLLGVNQSYGAIVTQYSFENNLLDISPLGSTTDPLSVATGTAETYHLGVVGQAVKVSSTEASVLSAADQGVGTDLDLTTNWTIEAFVNPDSANTGEWDRFITKWFDGSGNRQYHWTFRSTGAITVPNGQDLFVNNSANIINANSTATIPLNQWSHVAFTGNQATNKIQLWQDGVAVGETPYVAILDGGHAFNIGNEIPGGGNALQFSGLVDEVLIHNVAQGASYMANRTALIAAIPPPVPPPTPSEPAGVATTTSSAGLLSYWTYEGNLNDTAGSVPGNASTTNDNLTNNPLGGGGTDQYSARGAGQALSVGQISTDPIRLRAPNSPDVQLPNTYTIETWISPSELSDSWQRIALNWGASNGGEFAYHFAIRNNTGFINGVSLFHGQSNAVQVNTNGGTVVLDQWQHIAAVADGSMIRVYLNGVEVDAQPYDGTTFQAASEGLGIADSDISISTITFNGFLDDTAMWSRALSPTELLAHYNARDLGYGIVPEPSSMVLGFLALLSLVGYMRVKKSKVNS